MKKCIQSAGILLLIVTVNFLNASDNTAIVNRLEKHIKQLHAISKKRKEIVFTKFKYEPTDTGQQGPQIFKNLLIAWSVHNITKSHNLDALYNIWQFFKSYGVQADDEQLFLKEISIVIFMIYRTLLPNEARTLDNHLILINDLLALYNKLVSLPIDRLLDTLDECLEQVKELIDEFSERIEAQSSHIQLWRRWGIPLVIVGGIGYIVYKRYNG